MYAILGEIQFDLITYIDGIEGTSGADFAEHALIEGKPRLQFIGDQLDEYALEFTFHDYFCDPQAELVKLKQAKDGHKAMAFVLGNGDYKGYFVITELRHVLTQTSSDGTIIAMTANMTLREYVGDPKSPISPPAVNPAVEPTLGINSTAINVGSQLRQGIKTAVTYANKAKQVADVVRNGIAMAKSAKSDPMAALTSLPNLGQQFDRLGQNLGLSLGGANQIGQAISSSRGLINTTTQAISFISSASSIVKTASSGNVFDALDASERLLNQADGVMGQSKKTVAQLSAKLITRSA